MSRAHFLKMARHRDKQLSVLRMAEEDTRAAYNRIAAPSGGTRGAREAEMDLVFDANREVEQAERNEGATPDHFLNRRERKPKKAAAAKKKGGAKKKKGGKKKSAPARKKKAAARKPAPAKPAKKIAKKKRAPKAKKAKKAAGKKAAPKKKRTTRVLRVTRVRA